jgi:hypothetical protein
MDRGISLDIERATLDRTRLALLDDLSGDLAVDVHFQLPPNFTALSHLDLSTTIDDAIYFTLDSNDGNGTIKL